MTCFIKSFLLIKGCLIAKTQSLFQLVQVTLQVWGKYPRDSKEKLNVGRLNILWTENSIRKFSLSSSLFPPSLPTSLSSLLLLPCVVCYLPSLCIPTVFFSWHPCFHYCSWPNIAAVPESYSHMASCQSTSKRQAICVPVEKNFLVTLSQVVTFKPIRTRWQTSGRDHLVQTWIPQHLVGKFLKEKRGGKEYGWI